MKLEFDNLESLWNKISYNRTQKKQRTWIWVNIVIVEILDTWKNDIFRHFYTNHFFFSNYDNHFNITSSLFWLFAETLKQATVLFFFSDYNSIFYITYCYFSDPAMSFLFPKTNNGIPAKLLLWSNSWSWALARSMLAELIFILLWS